MTLQKQNNNTGLLTHKRLSVQISLIGHSFLISHTNTKEVLFFEETVFDYPTTPETLLTLLKDTINKTPALQTQFDTISIIHCNDVVTTVPKSLFDPQKAAEYLKFNSKILATDYIATDTIDTLDLVTVYAPYINVNNYIFETYGSFSYYHATTKFLENTLHSSGLQNKNAVHINVSKNSFICIVSKKNQLQLCNTYPYKTPEDFIYYVLFCFEQLSLNTEEDLIILSGSIQKTDPLYKQLYTYIRNISFEENPQGLLIKETKKHTHFIISNS